MMGLAVISSAIFIATLALLYPWLKNNATRAKAITSLIVCICLSIALYLTLGSPLQIEMISSLQQQQQQSLAEIRKIEQKPEKVAEDYTKIGVLYTELEDYTNASESFRKAVLESRGNPMLILAYAKAQMLAADGTITEAAKAGFTMANNLMPENPEPLFYLAVERMQTGDQKGARKIFAELLPKLPESSPLKRMVEMQLRKHTTQK